MDLFHRLNPFHRPPSASLHRDTPTPTINPFHARPSSALDNANPYHHPSPYSSIDDSVPHPRDPYSTPLPPPSPTKRSGHHRTPSMLRSLAHYPSLSALKSKSKKKGGKKEVEEVPAIPVGELSGEGKGRTQKLNGSRSVPRDLRLSADVSKSVEDPLTPLPSPCPHPLTYSHRSITPVAPASDPTLGSIARRTAPPPTPDITVYHDCSATPESVKMRMRLEVDVYSFERSPMSDDSPVRRRYTSFDDRPSPGRLSSARGPHRHLSSPAPPSHPVYTTSPGSASDLPASPSCPSARDTTYNDSFDMFTGFEELPIGTPGGKKASLRRGACVDGEKHEKDAVRSFSRDMYTPALPSSNYSPATVKTLSPIRMSPNRRRAESSPSPSRNQTREEFKKAAKRSSSPFEIKLSPFVAKRISLDAFGTSTPGGNIEGAHRDAEEVLCSSYEEFEEPDSEENDGGRIDRLEGDDVSKDGVKPYETQEDDGDLREALGTFRTTTLSTIRESPSPNDRRLHDTSSIEPRVPTPTPRHSNWNWNRNDATYRTPLPQQLSPVGLPLPPSEEASPCISRKYMSAPPLGINNSLLNAHLEHTHALQSQIKAGELMMDVLRSENEDLRECLGDAEREKTESLSIGEARVAELEKLRSKCDGKDQALDQLRQAMLENEEFFNHLQETHDTLAERCAELEKERGATETAREAEASAQRRERKVKSEVTAEIQVLKERNKVLEKDQKAVEGIVFDLRRELAWAEGRLREFEDVDKKIVAKDAEIQSISSMGEQRAKELQSDVDKKNAELAEADMTNTLLQDLMNIEMTGYATNLSEKDQQLENLHQKLAQLDSSISELTSELADLQATMFTAVSASRTAEMNLVEKDRTIAALREKLELARFEVNETHFNSQAEMEKLREQIEELTRMSAEREWAGKQANEMLAKFMEERRVWDEEKEELVEMINRLSKDESPQDNLQARVQTLQDQLSEANRNIVFLRGSLQDQKATSQHKITLLSSQNAELLTLRVALVDTEEQLAQSRDVLERQSKDSDRCLARLRAQVQDLEARLESHDFALRSAVVEAESEKAYSRDSRSRLERYLCEIDELKLSETKLRSEVNDLRRDSATSEVKKVEFEKKILKLEEDKELLNVALESKTMELVLFQRKEKRTSGVSASTLMTRARPASATMSMSTSKIPTTPTPSTGLDATPLPKRLAASTSVSTSTMRARRDSFVLSGSTSRIPLGASTRHNKTPDITISAGKKTVSGSLEKSISRRSSLPVLVRKPSVQTSAEGGGAGQRASLKVVAEV
ncbi:hypothetical protein IAR55_002423 [Kwoniella newhampshirensis]|uniref:Uncharacterized protein n=1 Tax=Kwoniella newhampshirensis TaxID=1651941 RepID=A0AAW0Z0Z4_9TREE